MDWAKFWNGLEAYLPETDFFVFCLHVGESCEVERAREISQSEAYLPETKGQKIEGRKWEAERA